MNGNGVDDLFFHILLRLPNDPMQQRTLSSFFSSTVYCNTSTLKKVISDAFILHLVLFACPY
jgi:hypothetical protein